MSTGTPTNQSTHTPDQDTDDPSMDEEETEGLPAPVHRNEDGDPLAISVVLSPDQIDGLSIPDNSDTVRPVVRDGTLHIEPADA
jgi:hypothetical protein